MSIYGIGAVSTGVRSNDTTVKRETESKKNTTQESKAAVYDKAEASELSRVTGKKDTATIERMKKEADEKTAQLRSLVEKMLTKQGKTYHNSTNIYELLRTGAVEVDAETQAKAKEEIAEDGYWGVEQTSDRMVSFAKALAGNDPSKADALMSAMKKGFEQATKAWGDELPEICQQTLDAAMEKMKEWKNGTKTEE